MTKEAETAHRTSRRHKTATGDKELSSGESFPEVEPAEHKFSDPQKAWLDRAWREYFSGQLPDLIARLEYACGEPASRSLNIPPNVKIEWHHISPGYDCASHNERINDPRNAVPLPKWIHTGPHDLAIHADISDAKRLWPRHLRGDIPDPFGTIPEDHKHLAQLNIPYWDTSYDVFFRGYATVVVREYKRNHPDDLWPSDEGKLIPQSFPGDEYKLKENLSQVPFHVSIDATKI